jgi:hypothetical protein
MSGELLIPAHYLAPPTTAKQHPRRENRRGSQGEIPDIREFPPPTFRISTEALPREHFLETTLKFRFAVHLEETMDATFSQS